MCGEQSNRPMAIEERRVCDIYRTEFDVRTVRITIQEKDPDTGAPRKLIFEKEMDLGPRALRRAQLFFNRATIKPTLNIKTELIQE